MIFSELAHHQIISWLWPKVRDKGTLWPSYLHNEISYICNRMSFDWDASNLLVWGEFNSLWSGDAKWWHRSGWTLPQVMARCLSHYLNQCWLFSLVLHLPESILAVTTQATILYDEFESYTFKIINIFSRCQWVKFEWVLFIYGSEQHLLFEGLSTAIYIKIHI